MDDFLKTLMAAREVPEHGYPRYKCGIPVIDEIFTQAGASGLRAGVYLLGGDPGCGKSTFCLQLLSEYAKRGHLCVYGAYEGREQVQDVMRRIGLPANISIVDEELEGWEPSSVELGKRMDQAAALGNALPLVLCIDSAKMLDSGSLKGRKTAIDNLRKIAMSTNTIVLVIAHSTKDSQGKKRKKLEGPQELVALADHLMYLTKASDAVPGQPTLINLDISEKSRVSKVGIFQGFKLRENGFEFPTSISASIVVPVAQPGKVHASIKTNWPGVTLDDIVRSTPLPIFGDKQ